ncbi:MAG: 2OG-Fe(II) oxygenase [Acidobacteriia bacterium]|nr:2OG-Fe(II) oxygenase [Terriglobia bacterium]
MSLSASAGSHDVFTLDGARLGDVLPELRDAWNTSSPFKHVVQDSFLSENDARILSEHFPKPDHPVWLDWKKRSPFQYGKQGPGNSTRFSLLDWQFRQALYEFNSSQFLEFLEGVTSITRLIPDPYFSGGGMHQILNGGVLDIHTDFNFYEKLNLYRRLNVLLYLTTHWEENYGGSLELWENAPRLGGKCFKSIAPIYNRLVIFETDKTSFHGHPQEWRAPAGIYRRSIALYYYTVEKVENKLYDANTDFQGYASKELPPSVDHK